MGLRNHSILAALLLATAHGQNPSNAPALTTPDIDEPDDPSLTEGLLTPDTVLPDGFNLQASQFQFDGLMSGDDMIVDALGPVSLRTNRGDTLRSRKARLDFTKGTQSSRVSFSGKVRMKTKNDIEIFADEALLDEKEQRLVFSGNVAAYQGTAIHRGERAIYYYDSRRFETRGLRTSFAPFLLESGRFRAVQSGDQTIYKGNNAGVTTHDAEKPNFWLRGSEVTVVPDETVQFKNLKLYAGDTPILWLPGLSQDFDGEFNYRPTPGMRSNWGPYLLNQYNHRLGGLKDPVTGLRRDAPFEAQWNFDLYSRRGVGTGLRLLDKHHDNNPNLGWLHLYHIHDFNSSIRRSAEPRLGFDDTERYKLQLKQRVQLNLLPGATGHADINSTLLSDRFFLEDYDPDEYTTEFAPDNLLSLSQQWDDAHLLTVWTRFRPNEFYQSDTRYPEIAFDQVRRPILGTPVLHESQNTFGIYTEELANLEERNLRQEADNPATTPERQAEIATLLSERGFARFHTNHELSLPITLDSGLHITPRFGAGYTRYDSIDGPLNNFDRTHVHASLDASLKFSKPYPDWISKKWGLDSALHIIQPYATLTLLGTDDLDSGLQAIERLTASTRPRALTPGRFTAVDAFADWQILRLGTRNRILTKRNSSSHEWLTLDSYIDLFGNDPEFNRNVSNLYNDIHWAPLPWLDLTVETQVPLFSDSNFTEVATGLYYQPSSNSEIQLSHRFLTSHPILEDSNRLELETYYRFNEEWGISTSHRWEFEDSTLEFQQYSLHRNLDSWIFNFGLFTRDNLDEYEYGVMFGFTLVDFPAVNLPLQVDN